MRTREEKNEEEAIVGRRRRRREERKKEKHFGRLATFWFGTFVMLFSTTGRVVRHESTRR